LPIVQAGLVSAAFTGLSSATSYYLLNGNAGRSILRPMVISIVIFVVAGSIAILPIAAVAHAMWAAAPAIASLPAVALINAVTGYVVGIRRVRAATSLAVATTFATLLFTAAGLFLVALTPFAAIIAWVAAATLVAVIAWGAMLLHARSLKPGSAIDPASYTRMALKVGAASLVSLLNYRADLYIVAVLLPPLDLGLYSVATSAPQALLLPTQVAAFVTSPHIGGLDRAAAARLAARCVRNNLLVAVVLCAVLFAVAPIVVGFFYGDAFLPLVPALRILLAGVVFLALGSPVSTYYTLKLAKPEIPLILAGASAAVCIAGCFLLIPLLGIEGAALASSAGYIIGQGLGLWYFARTTGVAPSFMLVPTVSDLRVYWNLLRPNAMGKSP
jgi:O-antigen/teichoic acid export membrane protein